MRDPRIMIGVVLGLVAAALLGSAAGPAAGSGLLVEDVGGPLRELVIQYTPEARTIVTRAYREFLGALPSGVTVRVLCPDRAAFDELRGAVGEVACDLEPVIAGHAITCWSRDRWLAFHPARPGDPAVLMPPRLEDGEGAWAARSGDRLTADDLAKAFPDRVTAKRSTLVFDGGDFVADEDAVVISPRVLRRNLGVTVDSKEDLARIASGLFGREVILLEDAPDHHAGMYVMLAGDRTALVGDPASAFALLGSGGAGLCPPAGPDRSAETQARFDAVADQLAEAGYRVVRIPVLPGADGRTFVTHLNAILDREGDHGVVYMPVFRGADRLNEAAAGVWKSLGYVVRTVDCTEAYVHFGSLRCLVNVLRREPS